MSKIFKLSDPMMIVADYKNPELHRHLAYHIIVSLGGEMVWKINNEENLDTLLLKQCGIDNSCNCEYDKRIEEILS